MVCYNSLTKLIAAKLCYNPINLIIYIIFKTKPNLYGEYTKFKKDDLFSKKNTSILIK